jgi:hypothetical protein
LRTVRFSSALSYQHAITQRWVMIIRCQLIVIYMNKEMTTCEYDGDPRQLECQREEQCDDCFMIDHLKECEWCEHYDHPVRKLEVKHLASEYTTTTAI